MDDQALMEWSAGQDHFQHDRLLATASELYDQVIFKTDSLFNEPAPEYWVSFVIGGVFSFLGVLMWIRRVYQCKQELAKLNVSFQGLTVLRAMISRAIDNDDAAYTIVSFAAFSFLFLGGLQLAYQTTFVAMIIVYIVVSCGDSLRIVLAMLNANSLADVVQTSRIVHSKLRAPKAVLNPSNVYEDLGRGATIMNMVFITQVLLISFVVVDVYEQQTTSCRDGSANCPAVGTFGSYGFYVLGIFMACVYLLGPKTSFGQSEQNPAYWIQLLIAAKRTGAKISWFDPVQNQSCSRTLSPNDIRLWVRFFMSWLINGVGFHILVHALPIQVATQSSLTGVVIRTVGMMYLVDLDDSPGYTLTIVEDTIQNDPKPDDKKDKFPEKPSVDTTSDERPSTDKPTVTQDSEEEDLDLAEMSEEAHRIIEEAQARLNALSRGEYNRSNMGLLRPGGTLAAGAVLMTGELANAQTLAAEGGVSGDGGAGEGAVQGGDGGVLDVETTARK